MPKLKTHKGTAARFRATSGGKGKLMRMYHGRGHFKRHKRGPVKVLFGRTVPVSKTDSPRIKQLLEGKN